MNRLLLLGMLALAPLKAQALTLSFGGTFVRGTPVTTFTAPGKRFTVAFDLPAQTRQFGQFVSSAAYTLGRNSFTTPLQVALGGQPGSESISISPGNLFDFAKPNIAFRAQDYYTQIELGLVQLNTGSFTLSGGTLTNLSLGSNSGVSILPIVQPRRLVITDPLTARSFLVPSISVPEAGTLGLMLAGIGILGAVSLRRRLAA